RVPLLADGPDPHRLRREDREDRAQRAADSLHFQRDRDVDDRRGRDRPAILGEAPSTHSALLRWIARAGEGSRLDLARGRAGAVVDCVGHAAPAQATGAARPADAAGGATAGIGSGVPVEYGGTVVVGGAQAGLDTPLSASATAAACVADISVRA